ASDKEENMKTRISSLRNEVSQIQNHVDQINSETLPKLVREGAQLLTMPVVKGDYDQQITLQEMHIAKQDLICNHLMKQKTSFELLLLGYELELRKHRDVSRQLKTVIQDLQMISESVEKRLTLLNDASLSSTAKSRNNIDSKDSSSHRLYDLLEDNKMQKLFRTYSGLESVAQKLTKDIASLKDQVIVSKQEQSIILSKLDADLKSLSDFMYPKGKTVLLNTP
ncbi:HAUS augmin-like complex subunit 3, partial [Bombina bombina]|uniref:HAUS augmin-like complex subunit 3 n=1 Tax=Bombina bombina TaxID=8345 RepID=UPI00235AA71C